MIFNYSELPLFDFWVIGRASGQNSMSEMVREHHRGCYEKWSKSRRDSYPNLAYVYPISPEIPVNFIGIDILNETFQSRHPTRCKMAILKDKT